MTRFKTPLAVRWAFVAAVLVVSGAARARAAVEFEVTLDPAAARQAVSGRLYVFLSQRPLVEPRDGVNWFAPEPLFGIDVKDFQPGTSRRVNDAADGFPDRLSKLPPGKYRAQALLGHNPDSIEPKPRAGESI